MCMKYPAEIFIEIRVCLRLSRSPGASGSHYHSLSRITIPDETDKTLSNCLQLPPPLSEGLSLLMRSLHQMIILQSPWLGGACGTQEWLSVRIKDARIWGELLNYGQNLDVLRWSPVARSHDASCSVQTWSLRTVGNVLSRALKAWTKNWKKRKEHRPKKVALVISIQTLNISIIFLFSFF